MIYPNHKLCAGKSLMKCKLPVLLAVVACLAFFSCSKENPAEKFVLTMMENQRILSDADYFQEAYNEGEESEKGKAYFAAKTALDEAFGNNAIQKRILATLRLYNVKAWEIYKSEVENESTYIVMLFRSDSEMMGQPFEKRPGWRRAIFQLQQKDGKWLVTDLDDIVKKYGQEAIYMTQEEESP